MTIDNPEPDPKRNVPRSRTGIVRWLLPIAGLVAFVGYSGAWVYHRVAGLAILGIDLGEYVKFLPSVRSGEVKLWREAFYLPLVAISLTYSLIAFRAELCFQRWLRLIFLAGAIVAAWNLLPPAWTPSRMLTGEFRQQAIALLLCLTAMALSPLLALWPARLVGVTVAALGMLGAMVPTWQFFRVLPDISALYNHALWPGWGLFVMVAGLLAMAAGGALLASVGKKTQTN